MLPLRLRFVIGMVKLPGENAGGVCEIMPRKSSAPQPMLSLRGMLLPLLPALASIDDSASFGCFSRLIVTGMVGGNGVFFVAGLDIATDLCMCVCGGAVKATAAEQRATHAPRTISVRACAAVADTNHASIHRPCAP